MFHIKKEHYFILPQYKFPLNFLDLAYLCKCYKLSGGENRYLSPSIFTILYLLIRCLLLILSLDHCKDIA